MIGAMVFLYGIAVLIAFVICMAVSPGFYILALTTFSQICLVVSVWNDCPLVLVTLGWSFIIPITEFHVCYGFTKVKGLRRGIFLGLISLSSLALLIGFALSHLSINQELAKYVILSAAFTIGLTNLYVTRKLEWWFLEPLEDLLDDPFG